MRIQNETNTWDGSKKEKKSFSKKNKKYSIKLSQGECFNYRGKGHFHLDFPIPKKKKKTLQMTQSDSESNDNEYIESTKSEDNW